MAQPKYTPTLQDNLDAYTRVLKAIDDNVISCEKSWVLGAGCAYEVTNGGKPIRCAIGALLTPAQIADVKRRNANTGAGVYALAKLFGKANIQKVTGLKLAQGSLMQRAHDSSETNAEFREWVTARIASKEKAIARQQANVTS